MGVPRLFPYLIFTWPECVIRHFQQGEFIFPVDNLYIDGPSLLHASHQLVHNYGNAKRKMDRYEKWSQQAKQIRVYEIFFESIVQISEIVVPTKMIYLGIDGVAPVAKQAQQRQRRFPKRGSSTAPEADPTSMTPGTVFMLELTKYLHTAIRKKIMEAGSSWRDLNIYFSSPLTPAEGEHKCLNFIRDLPPYVAENESHCIFGPDGDLIMLALAAHLPKMYLFREDLFTTGYYHLLDMGVVREKLPQIFGHTPSHSGVRARHLNESSDDFILVGFFVGNDFLPKIQMFMFLEDGLELMIATYKKISNGGTANLITEKGEISHPGFTRFVEELARREIVYIADQAKIPPADPRFKNETLLKYITWGADGTPKLNMAGYRRAYYRKAGVDVDSEDQVKKMCIDYLRTITWVFKYYVHGLPSWRHFYPWHYAPLMGDLAQTMRDVTPEDLARIYTFAKDQPSLPFVQLLSVIPPSSAHLLPGPFRHLLTSPESPLVKKGYYPDNFITDYEGKTKEHMGVTLLPFVNIDDVIEAYQPIAADLKNTYVRNMVRRPAMLRYDPDYLASYTSDYGNIPKMKVRKFIL